MASEPTNLALTLATADARPALAALFALDLRLGETVASTSEAIVGQMRLAWWRDALTRLDHAPPPAEPVLRDVAARLVRADVTGTELARMTAGWEAILLADGADRAAIQSYAEDRGAMLFGVAARVLGGADGDAVRAAGRGWALGLLAQGSSNPQIRDIAAKDAETALADAFVVPWNTAVRPLGALALMVAHDLNAPANWGGSWRNAVSFLRFRLTGAR